VSDWHWVGEERSLPHPTTVKIRYRQPEPVWATLIWKEDRKTQSTKDYLVCELDEWQRGMASGQFVVAYDGDEVIGSWVIEMV
jgi:tRNA U34 2-thiouridine synthase MnmA/TrmU